ncbi:LytR/AlgR family response regulator transcription factor [Chitinophagaceae bacterium MMS25-I14]
MNNTIIRSIIIDDEPANHSVLQQLLQRHCPGVTIEGHAYTAAEGLELLRTKAPELLFLDVKMPGTSGIEMLQAVDEINFDVIFISGFDEYAIQAFEFNAVDYVLKPVDYVRLKKAVDRALERKMSRNGDHRHIIRFIQSADTAGEKPRKLTLHQNEKVHVIDVADIVYLQASKGYCEINVVGGLKIVAARTLGEYEETLSVYENFLRINKSMVINTYHIRHYTKGSTCFISLRDTELEIEVSRRRKAAVLQALKGILPS